MKRYSPNVFGDMYPDTGGKWVEYSTAEAQLATLRTRAESAERALAEAREERDEYDKSRQEIAALCVRTLTAIREQTETK